MTRSRDVADTQDNSGGAVAPFVGGKNFIINGGFDFWQRATTSSSAGYQTTDRWYENASNTTTFSRETTIVPTDALYSFKMTAGATAQMWIQQPIETLNAISLAGKNIAASAFVSASTNTLVNIVLFFSTATDNPATGTWTGITPSLGGQITATSAGFARVSGVWAIPSNAKSIMVQVITPNTVASGVSVYVGNVQLELGNVATPFARAGGSIGGELALCQRYYYLHAYGISQAISIGTMYTNNQLIGLVNFPTTMRTNPTLIATSGTDYYAIYRIGTADYFNSFILGDVNVNAANIYNTTEIFGTAGDSGVILTPNTNARVAFSAEL